MANISKSIIQNAFNLFCKVYNLRTEGETTNSENPKEPFYKEAFVKMDYWQGYRITIVNKDTSESNPFGSGRKTAREMYEYIQGLLAAKVPDNFNRITL